MAAFVTFHPCTLPSSSLRNFHTCSWHGGYYPQTYTSPFLGTRLPRHYNRVESDESLRICQVPRAMFSGGGIFGVGPSEIIVIAAVGWLLLGPKKLYALAKDTGKLFGELSRTAAEARDSFTEAIEMDMLASQGKDKVSVDDDPKEESEVEEEKEKNDSKHTLQHASKWDDDVATRSTRAAASDSEAVTGTEADRDVNQEFLSQLKRASDPNQMAPPNIPDLSTEDEQEEFERLEREYLAAKRRKEGRKTQTQTTNSQDATATKEER